MRTYTREQVEQVVTKHLGENGVRTILRDLDALPNPPAVPESSTREEPLRCKDCAREDGDGGHVVYVCDGCKLDVCGDCTDCTTPDDVLVCADCFARGVQSIEDVRRLSGERIRLRGALNQRLQRPRAPTPVPEVPPYAKQDGTRRAALTRLHEGLDLLPTGVLASNEPTPSVPALKAGQCPCPDAPARHKFSCNLAQPGPTAPHVVWTGDGMRVLADGTWEFVSGGTYHEGFNALARALAEAKREAAQHHVAGEAVRHAAQNQSWATAGGDVIAIHAARLASDTADAVREAAESMRERAAKAARDCACAGNSREWAAAQKAIEEDIRALPLEPTGEVPSTVDADLAARALVDAVHTAVNAVADEVLAHLDAGSVGTARRALAAMRQAVKP